MARSYTTLPLTDDHGLPLINVMVQAYDASDDSLVETAYTGTAGTAAFTALPDDANYYFIARWGNKTLRWTRDFTLPTKEFFIPVGYMYDDSAVDWVRLVSQGGITVARIAEVGDEAGCNFRVPHDFNSLTNAYMVIIPLETKANTPITLNSSYGAEGESYNNHTEADGTYTKSITDTQIALLDMTGILSGISPGDYVGAGLTPRTSNTNFDVMGLMIYYQ